MAKDESARPVVSTLEVVDGETVAVVIPPGVESDVVADPIFVPVAVFVARVVVQWVAPVVVRAVIQGAKQVLSKDLFQKEGVRSRVANRWAWDRGSMSMTSSGSRSSR